MHYFRSFITVLSVCIILAMLLVDHFSVGSGSPPVVTAPSTLPDTSNSIGLALTFNYREADKATESGNIDYVWGADTSAFPPFDVRSTAWHEFYLPWPQLVEYTVYDTPWFRKHHPNWLMYRKDRATLAYFSGEYIANQTPTLDYTNPAVRSFIVGTFLLPALARGFQGISIDHGTSYNQQSAVGHFSAHGKWIGQYSGALNDAAYARLQAQALAAIVRDVHTRFPNASFTMNQGLDPSHQDPKLYSAPLASLTAIFDEICCTNGGDAGTPYTESIDVRYAHDKWLAYMNEYEKLQESGIGLVLDNREPYTITSNITDTNDRARFDLQWVLANYLLIRHNHTYLYWGSQKYGFEAYSQREYALAAPIGRATGPFAPDGKAYIRTFTHGLVLVNPAPSASATVSLPAGRYTDLYGKPLGASVVLVAHSGLIALGTPTDGTAPTSKSATLVGTVPEVHG